MDLYSDEPAKRYSLCWRYHQFAATDLEHREGVADGFTKRHGLRRLVYVEHDDIRTAIQLEKNMKHWPRRWKGRLILDDNPGWTDLYDNLV